MIPNLTAYSNDQLIDVLCEMFSRSVPWTATDNAQYEEIEAEFVRRDKFKTDIAKYKG